MICCNSGHQHEHDRSCSLGSSCVLSKSKHKPLGGTLPSPRYLDQSSSALLSSYAEEYTSPHPDPNLLRTLSTLFLSTIQRHHDDRHHEHEHEHEHIHDDGRTVKTLRTSRPHNRPSLLHNLTASLTNDDKEHEHDDDITERDFGPAMGDELSSVWHLLRTVHDEGYAAAPVLKRVCATRWHRPCPTHHATHPSSAPRRNNTAAHYSRARARARSCSLYSALDDDDGDDDDDDDDDDDYPSSYDERNRSQFAALSPSDSSHDNNHDTHPSSSLHPTTVLPPRCTGTPLTFGRPGHFALGRISHDGP